jgi:hypothetical protein
MNVPFKSFYEKAYTMKEWKNHKYLARFLPILVMFIFFFFSDISSKPLLDANKADYVD